jgi:multidrug efflux pump subunit AcrA (membrane-fusion protein)
MLFKGTSESLSRLAVGMPVVVFVQEATTVPGYRVPSGALMKNPANQNIVWVKDQAERFEPRVVNITPLDGASIAVTSGLADGDRVVVEGASLINQVR